jgi:uncharacterized repeat protein (TIGR01451 family)
MTAAIAVPGMLAFSQPSSATTSFVVNSPIDAALSNPAGTSCVSTSSGSCTLRAAIQAADNLGGSSTITLQAGTYKLTIASTGADDPSTGDLDVKGSGTSITIDGAGASSTIINANHLDRAFAVQSGESLSISGVTVENGAQNDLAPSDNSSSPEDGGAFYNDGSLSINASVLTNNSAYSDGGLVFAGSAATSTSITNSTVSGSSDAEGYGGVMYASSGSITFANDSITGSNAYYYGGVLYDDESGNTIGAVTISNCNISDNSSYEEYGGALYLYDAGTLTISGSTFDDNVVSYYYGGAIWDESSGLLTVSGSTFDANSSGYEGYGGAIGTDNTDLSVSGSTFDGNVSGDGGALWIEGTSATAVESITTSTFSGNQSDYEYYGGAIYDDEGNLQISRSTFTGNVSSYYGGALYYESADGLYLVNDTFDDNVGAAGGAIYLDEAATTGSITLLNDTITRNTGYYGGGIAYPEYANTIENTIVAGNSGGATTDGGGDCYGSAATANAGSADKGGNIDSDGTCFSDIISRDQTGVNPDLGPLSNNGGPTETDAELPGSPAIGTAQAGFCPLTDQRGVARPSTSCDVGAYQTADADLAISASGPSSASTGNPVTESFTVTNNGPGAATGVSVSDTLPAHTSYFGASSSQGSCSGSSTVTCSLGTLNSSATGSPTAATVSIVFTPSQPGSVTDTASVSGSQTDPNLANNSASVTTSVTTSTVNVAPVVVTGAASKVKATSAKLSATINPAGASTSYKFQLGTSTAYGKTTSGGTLGAAKTASSVTVSKGSLKPGTTYDFRVVATNAIGTSHGQNMRFTTPKATPKSLSLSVSGPASGFTVSGKVGLPSGVTASEGCKGTVTVKVRNTSRTIVMHTDKLSAKCLYSNKSSLAHGGTVTITATFGGNAVLMARSTALTVKLS